MLAQEQFNKACVDISYKSDESCSDVSVWPSKGTRMYRRKVSMDYPVYLAISFPIISVLMKKGT
jgi:hypothetical protein